MALLDRAPLMAAMRLGTLDNRRSRAAHAARGMQETSTWPAAEGPGYHRYRVAEHHSSSGLAGASPEVLIGQIAARTSRLRVGSGGVMLSHYSSFKVAECFRMLETLFPGSIDLGIGRAPGSDQLTARALQPGGGLGLDRFPEQIANLVGYLGDCLPANHPFARARAMPAGPTAPEGGSSGRAIRARCTRRTSASASRSPTSSMPTAGPR